MALPQLTTCKAGVTAQHGRGGPPQQEGLRFQQQAPPHMAGIFVELWLVPSCRQVRHERFCVPQTPCLLQVRLNVCLYATCFRGQISWILLQSFTPAPC